MTARDALFASYKILSNEPGVQVHIIGEKNLLAGDPILKTLDAIPVPSPSSVAPERQEPTDRLLEKWRRSIQDMRLGEPDENGKPSFDWDARGVRYCQHRMETEPWRLPDRRPSLPNQALQAPVHQLCIHNTAPRPPIVTTEPLKQGQGIMVCGTHLCIWFHAAIGRRHDPGCGRSVCARDHRWPASGRDHKTEKRCAPGIEGRRQATDPCFPQVLNKSAGALSSTQTQGQTFQPASQCAQFLVRMS